MRTKFAVLLVLFCSLLGALWWGGWIGIITEADRVHMGAAEFAVFLLGLGFIWFAQFHYANWIANKLPVLALVGTVAGILLAFHDHPNLTADNGVAATEIGRSLVANLVGIAGYFWLSLTLLVCAGHEEA